MLISVLVSTVVFPFVGKLTDTYPAIKIVPYAFLLRFISTLLFFTIENPDSYKSYIVCVFMIVASIVEFSAVDSIFSKNLEKQTRGILCGIYMFFSNFGILLYSVAAGWLFDLYGPRSPFVLIGLLDLIFSIYVIKQIKKY